MVWIVSMIGIFESVSCEHDGLFDGVDYKLDGMLGGVSCEHDGNIRYCALCA
jgi:hypothetical protein